MVKNRIKKRRMATKGAIPPTEKKQAKKDLAAERLAQKELVIAEEEIKEIKAEISKTRPECFWTSRPQPPAKLTLEELIDTVEEEI